jgi:hypothetical protein
MSDFTETWSGPWHALQRTLAAGTGGSAVVGSADYRTALKPGRAPGATLHSRSWLRKAHARVCEVSHVGANRPGRRKVTAA